MLTAQIGENIINCFDGNYDRYRLKQWSNKGIIKCPVCGGDYEYCHGEVVSPYFRHVGKECDGYYSESETDEHRNGKLMIYDWIKNQDCITNCKLESWIPETKQRPDIYFEFDGERFVIEFQCSPIASEFLIRRELYKLAGIKDIWILGTEKYNVETDISGKSNRFNRFNKFKHIEKTLQQNNKLIYLDVKNGKFLFHLGVIKNSNSVFKELIKNNNLLKYYQKIKLITDNVDVINDILFDFNLRGIYFNKGNLMFNEAIRKENERSEEEIFNKWKKDMEKVKEMRRLEEEKQKAEEERIKKHYNEVCKFVNGLNQKLGIFGTDFELFIVKTKSPYYDYSIGFNDNIFFVKNNQIDFCSKYTYSKPYKNWRNQTQWSVRTGYKTLDSEQINDVFDNNIYNFIYENIGNEINLYLQRMSKLKVILDLNIKFIDSGYIVPKNIRFKFLKDYNFSSDNYVFNEFYNEIIKLKGKDSIVFMLKGKDKVDDCIKILKNKFKLINIEKLKNCANKEELNDQN